jgi:septal ring factor EnvC (AmiA/AmiB activator)
MGWALLVANVVLAGLLVHLWLDYQARATDLRRRQDAASQRIQEHQQEIEATRKEIAAVEAQLPEIEAQAMTLKEQAGKAQERLARLEMIEGGQNSSRHQV